MIKKGNQSSTEAYLRAVELPLKTKSYTPITHGDIIDKLASELSNANFVVEYIEYTHTYCGEVAGGKVYIRTSKDEDMGMMFSWMNSYNKMVKFSCGVGAFIYENNTSFFGTEGLSWIRMHTGTANAEAFTIIEQIVDHAHYHFDKIIAEKERMKANPITIETYSSIMGSLYFEHELLKPTQVTAIDREYKSIKSPVTDKDNLWGLYKVLMFGIDGADIKIWQQSQQKLHHMIMTEYDIAVEEPIPLAPNELRETGPPTQEEMKEVIRQCSSCGEPTVNKYCENSDCEVNQRDEQQEKVVAIEEGLDHKGEDKIESTVISREDCCIEGTHMTSVDADGFCNNCGEQEECTTTELEDIHEEFLQAEEQEVNEHVGPPEMYEGTEEVISEDEIDFTAIANKYSAEELVEPVSLIEPTINLFEEDVHQDALDKAAEGGSKEFMLPENKEENFLDIPEHDGLNISEDSLAFTNAIEKEMAILYGSVRPYKVTKTPTQTNVIIDETEECFYMSVT
tara:strand:+ start:3621 stop:5150 length:1530 start_codon:yes stop_codon:yes gene_type:complete